MTRAGQGGHHGDERQGQHEVAHAVCSMGLRPWTRSTLTGHRSQSESCLSHRSQSCLGHRSQSNLSLGHIQSHVSVTGHNPISSLVTLTVQSQPWSHSESSLGLSHSHSPVSVTGHSPISALVTLTVQSQPWSH